MKAEQATCRQWPHNITKGPIRYGAAQNYEGFYLADADHGIPTIGAVVADRGVKVFNYPGQTEDIARRLVACWNACVGYSIEEVETLAHVRATASHAPDTKP